MPRTGLDSRALQNKALDTAERLICQQGSDRLRLSDVARKLGITHAALYNHFADREALLDAVSRRWLERIDAELARIAGKNRSAESRVTEWFLALHRLKREKILAAPELYRAFEHSAQKNRPFIQTHLRTAMNQLRAIVQQGMVNGEIKRGDPTDVAMLLFEATAAFHHPRLVLENISSDRTPVMKRLIRTLMAGLR